NTAEDEKHRVAVRWVLTHWKEYQDECARRREAPPTRGRSAGVLRRPRREPARSCGREARIYTLIQRPKDAERIVYGRDLMAIKRARRSKRRFWSEEDVRELRAHSRSKSPVKKIARAMQRTAGALRQKARDLGLPLGHRR